MNRFIYNNSFKFRFWRHILFFLITVLVFTAIIFVQSNTGTFLNSLWITFLNALFFLIPEFLLTKKIGWFALLFLLVCIALSALKLVVFDQIFYSFVSPENIG